MFHTNAMAVVGLAAAAACLGMTNYWNPVVQEPVEAAAKDGVVRYQHLAVTVGPTGRIDSERLVRRTEGVRGWDEFLDLLEEDPDWHTYRRYGAAVEDKSVSDRTRAFDFLGWKGWQMSGTTVEHSLRANDRVGDAGAFEVLPSTTHYFFVREFRI